MWKAFLTKLRIGIYIYSLKNGGTERQMASLLNFLDKIRIFIWEEISVFRGGYILSIIRK